jgi:hypothetical protein
MPIARSAKAPNVELELSVRPRKGQKNQRDADIRQLPFIVSLPGPKSHISQDPLASG